MWPAHAADEDALVVVAGSTLDTTVAMGSHPLRFVYRSRSNRTVHTRPMRYLRMLSASGLLAAGAMLLTSSATPGHIAHSDVLREEGLGSFIPEPEEQSPPGTRVALLVGISDYPGTDNDLGGGPLNDVTLMSDLLINQLGFAPADVLTLTDADATPRNIVDIFLSRLASVPPSGVVVFYFSGHGSQFPDDNGEEPDSVDEVLVIRGDSADTFDIVRDDDLGYLASLLKAGRVLFILDNCYSGTGTRGIGRPLNLASVAGGRATTLGLLPTTDPLNRTYLPKRIPTKRFQEEMRSRPTSGLSVPRGASEPTNHLLLAASAENEESINLPLRRDDGSKVSVGLLTASLYLTLNSANARTTSFTSLVSSLRKISRETTSTLGVGPQTPQIEGVQQGQSIAAFLRVP